MLQYKNYAQCISLNSRIIYNWITSKALTREHEISDFREPGNSDFSKTLHTFYCAYTQRGVKR